MPRGSRPSTAALTSDGAKERERDRHVDMARAAVLAERDFGDAADGPFI